MLRQVPYELCDMQTFSLCYCKSSWCGQSRSCKYHADSSFFFQTASACSFVRDQFRANIVTSRQFCRSEADMRHLGDTYRTYLSSQRIWRHLHDEYHGKGERSVAETAKIVGFKLPHDPK